MPDPTPRRSMLQRRGMIGLTCRAIVLLLLEVVALAVVLYCHLQEYCLVNVPKSEILAIFAGIVLAMMLGLVFTELPSGDQHTFTRLGLATFCRTGLPLLVVVAISKYSVCDEAVQPIFAAVVFYAVGHFGGMILSTLPLKSPSSSRSSVS